jgi:hypothetical protein
MNLRDLLEDIKLKHGDESDEKFDPKEIQAGIKIEMEHTNDPSVAKQIAKAHLIEFPHYYTDPKGLLHMEKELKGEKFHSRSDERRIKIQRGEDIT